MRICTENVMDMLKMHVPDSDATVVFLQIIADSFASFIRPESTRPYRKNMACRFFNTNLEILCIESPKFDAERKFYVIELLFLFRTECT